MGKYGYKHNIGLMRNMDDECLSKGGGLPDADKWKIVGAVRGVTQYKNEFDCGAFACMHA